MINFMIWHWTIHIITALIFALIFINKKRVKKGKMHLHKKWIKSLKKILTKITKKVNNAKNKILFQIYHENDFEKLKNKILKDKKKGYKTVVVNCAYIKVNVLLNYNATMNLLHTIHYNFKAKVNFVFIARLSELNIILKLNLPQSSFILLCDEASWNYEQCKEIVEKVQTDLLIRQEVEMPLRNIHIVPNIFFDSNPYQPLLVLTSSHVYTMYVLSHYCTQILTQTNLKQEQEEIMNKIKQTLVLKNESNLQKHKAVYIQHLKQFQKFREKYKKIVLFAYSGLGYKVENGMAEMRRILSSIPKDCLIIFTIHPTLFIKDVTMLPFYSIVVNDDLEHNLNAELRNLNPEIKPLEVLKSEFPNFITEFDLELKKIHKTPECPSITNAIVNDVDFVMCGNKSKISFIAMESNKPIVAYKKTEDKNFSFEVLQLQTEDIANYDFTQNISEIYNKILHFLFTRIMQLPNLQFDLKPERLQEFINYEKQKRENGVCESDFEFYEKEWQTIEQVYNQFKK